MGDDYSSADLAMGADLADAIDHAASSGADESRESYDLGNRCDDCGGRIGAPSDSEGRIVDGCVCDGPWATPGWAVP